ncbi:hypothetical protein N7541_007950 [Penicillium brevicompactum]|uniref:Altered inheritance of mitochondria protein 9, mitochondrial n=1 Tax=Penicillium brevicompactum TaxID=5074 RepID=A0A9W9QY53_PENBR|nr:hypothetical protein N7541_007950 [Penicillium brevicompactum]
MSQLSTSLWRALEDGSGDFAPQDQPTEEPIDEADLYRYQRYRWLYVSRLISIIWSRETEKLAMRHRKFDLQGLIDVAVKAVGMSGINCVKVLKCVEGQFNKAFLLTMSNGFEIIARLPNPNAGPAFYTTASEVATRHFIRDKMGLPIPRIYNWSTDKSNPVGAEYFLKEKTSGQPLGPIWGRLSLEVQSNIMNQVTDLKSTSAKYERLQSPSIQDAQAPAFVIGPSADPNFWGLERAQMKFDRGPCKILGTSVAYYARALGINELEWAASHARPRMNFHRSTDVPERPSEYIAPLKNTSHFLHISHPGLSYPTESRILIYILITYLSIQTPTTSPP